MSLETQLVVKEAVCGSLLYNRGRIHCFIYCYRISNVLKSDFRRFGSKSGSNNFSQRYQSAMKSLERLHLKHIDAQYHFIFHNWTTSKSQFSKSLIERCFAKFSSILYLRQIKCSLGMCSFTMLFSVNATSHCLNRNMNTSYLKIITINKGNDQVSGSRFFRFPVINRISIIPISNCNKFGKHF